MTIPWKPPGYNSVSPYLITKKAQQVNDFLSVTLDATSLRRHEREDGSVMHAEVRIDDTVVMIGEAQEGWEAAPCHLHVLRTGRGCHLRDGVEERWRLGPGTGAEGRR